MTLFEDFRALILSDSESFRGLNLTLFENLRVLIPLTPMGVLAPGSAHERPSAQPPMDMTHMSASSPSNISPNYLELISKGSEISKIKKLKEKRTLSGLEVVPNIFFWGGGGVFSPFKVSINTLYSFRILSKPHLLFKKQNKTKKPKNWAQVLIR